MSQIARKFSERRRFARLQKKIPFKILDSEFDFVTETHDISASGASCMVHAYIPAMTKLRLDFVLGDERRTHIRCHGVVVRVEKEDHPLEQRYHVAVFFNDIKKKDADRINAYVHEGLQPFPA